MKRDNMKKILFALISGLIMIASVAAADYYIGSPGLESTYLKIVAEEITPEPVEPGQDITVKVRLHNYGDKLAEDVDVQLKAEYPFHLKSESEDFTGLDNMCSGCSRESTYYLTVDGDAVSGVYKLEFEISEDDGASKKTQEISVNVVGKPDIIFETEGSFDMIKPGEEFTAKLDFVNTGTGIARNVKIIPSSSNFIKLGSGLIIVEEIRPGGKEELEIDFNVADSVTPNSYNIPILITYIDEQGNSYNMSENLGVKVINEASLSIQNLKIQPSYPGLDDTVEFQIRVENVGEGDAENVKVKLGSEGFEGTMLSYLGKIESDDDQPAIFLLKPRKKGDNPVSIEISYDDDTGSHVLNDNFSVSVHNGNGTSYILIALIVLVGGGAAYLWLGRKRK
ncbi:COG1361 S-layer family protein [Candidatus Woesearchaeota archaeon]|nr:COG1361 S-layer family protein [Candidatus Woesearchaeota archaeon]